MITKRTIRPIIDVILVPIGFKIAKWKNLLPFAVPINWREPNFHISDCYFCLKPSIVKVLRCKTKLGLDHLSSAIHSVSYSDTFSVPTISKDCSHDLEELSVRGHEPSISKKPDFRPGSSNNKKSPQNNANSSE